MIENLPIYISIVFILTTLLTVGIFIFAFRDNSSLSLKSAIYPLLLVFWLIAQAILALSDFYLKIDAVPPRMLIGAILPPLLLIIAVFIFARRNLFEQLSLKTLTLLHIVRIPVELVLFWLFQQKLIPQLMTFEGRNFDILAGLTAPLIVWLAFRNRSVNRPLLIVWNIFALVLLLNIIVNAVLSFPFSIQQFGFEQPNRALLYFPYIWLPSIIVPIVLFSHLASLWKLLRKTQT